MIGRSLVYRAGAALDATGALRRLHRWLLPDVVSAVSYHGLIDTRLPVPSECFMPVERFEKQMEYLARHFTVLHLEEAFASGRPRARRPVACVTFDDGFESLHHLALPILERLSIPSTVYLVTDLVDTDDAIWYTRLHQAICETSATEISLGALRFRLTSPHERAVASSGLQQAIKALPRFRFAEVFEGLLDRLGVHGRRTAAPWAPMRILRTGEIRRMSRDGLVRFGSHTASHQILTRTEPDDVRREIERSVAAVAALVERPSRTFAYPNGGLDDFDATTIAAIRQAGIEYAVTTIEGPNPRDVDPYRIRRYPISAIDHWGRFTCQVHHARSLAETLSKKLGLVRPAAGELR